MKEQFKPLGPLERAVRGQQVSLSEISPNLQAVAEEMEKIGIFDIEEGVIFDVHPDAPFKHEKR